MVRKPGKNPRNFFTREERDEIVSIIREVEKKTSGEVRVFLEKKAPRDLMERARKIFEKLGMTKTKRRNGVLIYFSLADRQFVILGDRGIHEKVEKEFWDEAASEMNVLFKEGRFMEGMRSGIRRIGGKLALHFPWEKGDVNELSDAL